MAFFRQYIAPLFVVLIFFAALAAVSARFFLPDMAAPAPIEDIGISMMPELPIAKTDTAMINTMTINTVTTSPTIS